MMEDGGRDNMKEKVIAIVVLLALFVVFMQSVYANVPLTKDSAVCIIWVGNKNGGNLPGAYVYVDGINKGQTNSKGEVRPILGYGHHDVLARANCGGAPRTATKSFDFSPSINGVGLTISMCR